MKKTLFSLIITALVMNISAQVPDALKGNEVFKNDDVVFHQIDEHTWVGTGHMMYNESVYLIEGSEKALLIDAGTNMKDLDKIVASITSKPVMLVATHVHPDHTGSSINSFPEIFINPGDTVQINIFMKNYPGKVKYLNDGQIIDLGGRTLEVVFTPGHTPGSTTFMDTKAGYGFSGDSFGSGNLLLSSTFSGLIATCEKTLSAMDRNGVKFFYPGHYWGDNPEMRQRIEDEITLSRDVISGKLKGEPNPNGMMGLNLVVNVYGVRINYNENSIK